MLITEWYDIVLLVITGFSVLCAFYTFALIAWITPKSMSEYRWFLLLYTLSDAVFTFVFGVIICPKALFPGTGFVIQGLGKDIYYGIKNAFGDEGGDIIVKSAFMIMTWCFVNIISTQDYCLFYRFTVVSSNSKYHDLLVNKKVIAIIFHILISLIFSFPSFMFVHGMKDTQKLMKEFEKRYPDALYDITSDDVIIWLDEWSSQTNLFFGICFLGFFASEIIAISSVFHILKTLRKNAASFSAHTYKMHRQLTILLIIQIINPVIFIIFPLAACIFAVIFTLEYQRSTGTYGALFMSFYSISNTFLTIGFVSPYRQFTIGIILKLPFLKKYGKVTPITPMVSQSGNSFNAQLIRHQ